MDLEEKMNCTLDNICAGNVVSLAGLALVGARNIVGGRVREGGEDGDGTDYDPEDEPNGIHMASDPSLQSYNRIVAKGMRDVWQCSMLIIGR